MKIKTKQLDEALNKMLLVAEKTTLDPMTSIVSFFMHDNDLIACSTDKSNTLFWKLECEDPEDIGISVNVFSLAKLVHSISTDTIEFKVDKNILKIKGNGTYKFSSVVDGKGKNIMIGDRRLKNNTSLSTIEASTIKMIKSCLATSLAPNDFAVPDYQDYYMDASNVLTTNTDNASMLRRGILDNHAYKVSAKTVNILAGLNDTFELIHEGDLFSFRGTQCELVTKLMPIELCPDFQANLFVDVFNKPMSFSTSVNRNELLATLGRCTIFTDSKIELDFSNELTIRTLNFSVVETIHSSDNADKQLTVSLSVLMTYVKTLLDETIYIELDDANDLLKLSDSQIEHVLSAYA